MEKEDISKETKLNKFRSNINLEKLKQILTTQKQILEFIDEPVWQFKDQQTLAKVVELLEQIQESNSKVLKIKRIHEHTNQFLKSINFPSFQCLIDLTLRKCLITNIESISFLNAPALKKIQLQKNKISIGKSMHKWCFPQLRYLMVSGNLIQETENFSRIRLNVVTESYFEKVNKVMQKKQTKFKNVPTKFQIINLYNFNTKLCVKNNHNIEGDTRLFDCLYIEDPRFYAKLEFPTHLIDHVQINKDENILKFDQKQKKPTCPFEKCNQIKNKHLSQQIQFEEKRENFNQIFKKKSSEQQEKDSIQNDTKLKEQEDTNIMTAQAPQFRYLDQIERKKIWVFLMKYNYYQLKSYFCEDQKLGFDVQPIEIINTDLNRKKILFKRIQQKNLMDSIYRKFKISSRPKF